jgi:hypothetical protein
MTFDPKYKMRAKLTTISRLSKYERLPPPMVGDPLGPFNNWAERCEALYAQIKGIVPAQKRRSLWFWFYWAG